jgi:hypothetical protein
MMGKGISLEKVLWCIALPGFGQLLNGKYVKGLLFIGLEFLINMQSNLNEVIILSFQGDIQGAISQTNYQWLMFYPCLYMFAIWDAYRDSGIHKAPYAYLGFVSAAYMSTVGLIYSSKLKIFGVLWGPVWLTMLFCFVGLGIGYLIRAILLRGSNSEGHVKAE